MSEGTHLPEALEVTKKVGTHITVAANEAGEETIRGLWGRTQNIPKEEDIGESPHEEQRKLGEESCAKRRESNATKSTSTNQ